MKDKLIVVGIGASAGGLEALQTLFDNMPETTGMAFVVVQHLSPTFKSMMDELLAKHTKMPIQLADNNMKLKPNHVYLNPKEKNIIYEEGKIKYVDKAINHPLNLPIDLFFHSLGNELEENAIGIILSGTGTDGSRGIGTIKGSGGMVIVQEPDTAQFDGMPVTAINSGHAEFIVPPEKMGLIIDRITSNFLYKPEYIAPSTQDDIFMQILEILHQFSGIDFRLYKNSTLIRRVEKRLTINQLDSLKEYVEFLLSNENEQDFLVKDCLIGVTGFYRDNLAFSALKEKIFPDLFSATRKKNTPVRFWVSACSTGQEAYTLAMLIDEYLHDNNLNFEYKIFATDIDKESVQIAAEGKYPLNYVADLPKKVLERNFIKSGDFFEISKRIREKIVFSQHNLLKDPPFIKMDFVSCRNFLIYLLPKAQYKVIGTFQFGLNKGGYLFLGSSETLGDSQKMFKTIDSTWRIYQSTADYKELPSRLQTDTKSRTFDSKHAPFGFQRGHSSERIQPERAFTEKIAEQYGPACIFINQNYEILYINGDINDYVAIKPGMLKYSLMDILVDDKLVAMVRNGMRRIGNEKKKVVFKDIAFNNKRRKIVVSITFQQQEFNGVLGQVVLISFEKGKHSVKKEDAIVYDQYKLDEFSKQRIEDLESELKKTKQELQNTIEELETSNEELQASNEELQASNEELQSTNEELQSVNEELYTVNAEVQVKNKELIGLNEDVTNILNSTLIGTLFLDTDLRIRKFTPALQRIFQLNENDLGRPISNFASNFAEDIRKQIIEDSKRIIKSGETIEVEFQDDDNNFYLRKISPFLNSQNAIEGLVISFVDITRTKLAEIEVKKHTRYLSSVYNAAQTGIYVYNFERGVNEYINLKYTEILGYTLKEINEMTPETFFGHFHPDDQSAIANHMKELSQLEKGEVSVIKYRFRAKNNNWRWCLSHDTGYEYDENDKIISIVGSFMDITEQIEVQEKLSAINNKLEKSEYNLLQAQKIAHVGSWYLDVETNKVEWTEELYNMYGFDPTKPPPPYTEHMKLFTPESWELLSSSLAQTSEKGIPYELELDTVKKDGSKGWMWVRGEAIKNEKGEIIALWGAAQDISVRKEIEHKIRESEQNYKALFNNQNSAIAVHEMLFNKKGKAEDFIYIDGNSEQDKLLGIKRESYINKKVSEINPDFIVKHKDLLNTYAEVATTGKSNQFEIYLEDVKKWFNIRVYSHSEGFFATISIDITEQKKILADIENAKKLNDTLTETSPYGILLYDSDGNCIIANDMAAKLVNGTKDKLLKQNIHKIESWKKNSLYNDAVNTLKTGKFTTNTVNAETSFGKIMWLKYSFSRFSYNQKPHLVLTFEDVTDIKKAEAKLKKQTTQLIQAEKMNAIGTLTAGVAHELNNPLMGILNYAEYCIEHTPQSNKTYKVLQDLVGEADRSTEIIKSLLSFTRKEEADEKEIFNTDINRGINDCLKLLQLKTKKSATKIIFEPNGNEIFGNIRPSYLQQMVFNMVDNAIYAVEKSTKKEITIQVHKNNSWINISITDTGSGISKEHMNLLFDPFFTTKPVGKGTGLGLSICKNLIEESDGEITCKSVPGEGTEFKIKIPLIK